VHAEEEHVHLGTAVVQVVGVAVPAVEVVAWLGDVGCTWSFTSIP
jgi:hypothetical protein